jgi:hypothetical protein
VNKLAVVLSVIAILVGVANLAKSTFASIPDSQGVIHGCYVPGTGGQTSGNLRVIDTARPALFGGVCKPGEISLDWSATGPQGAPGTPGTPGAAGATNVVVRTATAGPAVVTAGGNVDCQAGERATGGGISATTGGTGGLAVVTESRPQPATAGATPTTWFALVRNIGDTNNSTVSATMYVVCASP